jgi:chemotaxis protein methyltransferase CheR
LASAHDNLGLSGNRSALLRDLIHERTGLFYENGRYETLGERLAPLVLERGFRSFSTSTTC